MYKYRTNSDIINTKFVVVVTSGGGRERDVYNQ